MYIRYKHLAYLVLVVLLTAGCNDYDIQNIAKDEVTFAAGTSKFSTRLSQDGSQWTEGDQVGIYSFATGASTTKHFSNVVYSAETTGAATVFKPINEYITYQDDDSPVDFMAYYPYLSTI